MLTITSWRYHVIDHFIQVSEHDQGTTTDRLQRYFSKLYYLGPPDQFICMVYLRVKHLLVASE